ncbi:DUF7167 family protein [Hymenobacter mucosus]|uniref:DUF7167 domain-containing protein n=1 Tax=Hymenobacter mucosus TaxID=1411120 RepID=A0A239A9H1_9BACT|nr:hypothetical protein [Hymenobacter mucosus]SNR91991.1 hypothetical protein SAMN06269173_11167 [Hymenobacter mucosus]
MLITLHCHVALNTASVDEDVEVEVPDEFADWTQTEQFEYLEDEYNQWLGSNMDSGYNFTLHDQ